MKIEAFIIMYNESEIIHLVIKHYQKFCEQITFFDNYSSDGCDKIAESYGCKVIKFDTGGTLSDEAYLRIKNQAWKESKADWVIVCDCDEILFADPSFSGVDLISTLNSTQYNIHRPRGWNIYSDKMPKDDLLEITNGYQFDNYSKCILFDPAIKEINFQPGAHHCKPVCANPEIYNYESGLYLLHYKQIGGVERLINRNKLLAKRLSMKNKRMGWGSHYLDSEARIRKEWNERMAISKPLL